MKKPLTILPFGAVLALIVAVAIPLLFAFTAHAETVRFPNDDHARFSVTVTGSGPDVILIPGLGCSKDVWDATVARYKGQYRLHVLNISGFAGEPAGANANGPVIAPSVEALDAYIKTNKLEKPAIVGHSMGGLMALMLGASHPEDAGKLIIVDAFPFIGTIFGAPTVDAATPQAERFKATMLNATPAEFEAMQRGMVGGASAPAYGENIVQWTLSSDRKVMAQAMYDDMITDVRPELGRIKAKLTLFYPYRAGAGMTLDAVNTVYATAYRDVAGASLVRIDNASHFLMLDQPEAFYTALDEVLK